MNRASPQENSVFLKPTEEDSDQCPGATTSLQLFPEGLGKREAPASLRWWRADHGTEHRAELGGLSFRARGADSLLSEVIPGGSSLPRGL